MLEILYIIAKTARFASGGGVMLYVRSDIPQPRRHDLEKLVDCSESGLEIIIIKIITDSKERWMYVMGYKPPDIKTSLFVNTFSLMCDLILKESNNVIVLGDYNFMSDNELKDLCISFDIHNLVNTPTCYKSHSGTLVDVCLVSKSFRFQTTLNLDCWLSDFHNFICVTTKLSLPKRQPRIIQYRSYKNFVEELFVTDLCILSQIMMHYNHNVDVCVETFITYSCGIIDKHAPMKTKKVYQSNVPYMNSELRKLNYQRTMMRNIKNKHPCPENFERYKVLRNKCVKAKVKSQRKYFAERCDGGPNNQHFWPTIKHFISSRYNVKENVILCEGDDIINNTETVVKIFNEYFNQIDPIPDSCADDDVLLSFIAIYNKHPSIITIKSAVRKYGIFEFRYANIDHIYQILVTMNDKKATGCDGIPCKLLKIGAFPLAEILCNLINMSVDKCVFPGLLKFAEISALFKKLDRLCKENYRPVSILTDLSKVYERDHANQISSFFEKIFSKFLSGFRKGYICQTTLLRMIQDWKTALDNGNFVGSIAVDLSKAFNSLPHGLLVAKLHAYGVEFCLHVKYYAAIYIIATTEWKCVTWKVSG